MATKFAAPAPGVVAGAADVIRCRTTVALHRWVRYHCAHIITKPSHRDGNHVRIDSACRRLVLEGWCLCIILKAARYGRKTCGLGRGRPARHVRRWRAIDEPSIHLFESTRASTRRQSRRPRIGRPGRRRHAVESTARLYRVAAVTDDRRGTFFDRIRLVLQGNASRGAPGSREPSQG